MSDIRKDHSIGTGTGAAAGAIAGAAVGTMGGPIGIAAGAVVGGLLGAGAGGSLAEAVNPTVYEEHFKSVYMNAPYYAAGRDWSDYEPAYNLGYNAYGTRAGRTFDDIDADLQRDWDSTRGNSRLSWSDARSAALDGWYYVDNAMPSQTVVMKQ
jgi:uncharacterized protein YcfJ